MVVVHVAHAGVVETAEDAGEAEHRQIALLPHRRGAVQVEPIGPGRAQQRAVPAVAQCRLVAQRVGDRQLLAHVVAHHVVLRRAGVGFDEAVVGAVVPLVVARTPVVRRIGRGEGVELVHADRVAVRVRVALAAGQAVDVGPSFDQRQRAEVVVERAVLHAQHDEGVDAGEQLLGAERVGRARLLGRVDLLRVGRCCIRATTAIGPTATTAVGSTTGVAVRFTRGHCGRPQEPRDRGQRVPSRQRLPRHARMLAPR